MWQSEIQSWRKFSHGERVFATAFSSAATPTSIFFYILTRNLDCQELQPALGGPGGRAASAGGDGVRDLVAAATNLQQRELR